MEIWLDFQRRMPAGKKLESELAFNRLAIELSKAGVRMAYPESDNPEVFHRAASRLGADLVERLLGEGR